MASSVPDDGASAAAAAATADPAAAAAEAPGRRIVVAVDESEESTHALNWCLANVVSSSGGDTLVLLHARRPRPVYAAMDSSGYMMTSDVMASMDKYAAAVSAAAVGKAKHICAAFPHVTVETMVESGDPRDVICDATEKMAADLLVMGTHGYGLIQRAFLGSVSNHCAQNCKCPVLIVKRPK
ncbi:universal stress protein PHOS34-like [Oryza glaberrima]|uniref:UspA domain-containing protein n=2 Tax=Oryza TaxID=4527 RepID=A0A0D3EMJ9_9ORYZ|nr:universal stress protein PHOS34-like [Oryza glaberrima]XP_052147489.1 universal stress protein PHOS34-like [Oryza glaberrima]